MAKISRRSFLKIIADGLLALSGLLGLGGLLRFLSYKPEPPPPARFEVGAPGDFLPESRTILPAIPAILIRSKNTFRAFSLVCTHLGCTVQVNSDEYICPCHGSRYDQNGLVTQAPASSSLQELRVEQTPEGKLVIYKDRL